MSQENVEVVVAAMTALASEGLEAFVEYFTDDVDYRAIEGAPDDRGPLHGKDDIRAYEQDWDDTFDDLDTRVVELIDAGGDKVITAIKFAGRAKLSGVQADQTYFVVFCAGPGVV